MRPPRITPAGWLDDLGAEFDALATGALGLPSVSTVARGGPPPSGTEGAYLGIGLPTFFHGAVQPAERLGVAVAEVRVGDLPAALLALHPRTRQAEEI